MDVLLYFVFAAALFFLMMRFGCGAHVMGHGHRHGEEGGTRRSPGVDAGSWTAPATSVDPVCGMTVEPAKSKSSVHNGRVYYFCSQDCREKFENAPASYEAPASEAAPMKEHHHAC